MRHAAPERDGLAAGFRDVLRDDSDNDQDGDIQHSASFVTVTAGL